MIFFWVSTALLIGYIIYLFHGWLISYALVEVQEGKLIAAATGWPILGEIWPLLVATGAVVSVLSSIGSFWLARKTEKIDSRIQRRKLTAEVRRLQEDLSRQNLSNQKIYSIALADANEQLHRERSALEQNKAAFRQKESAIAREEERLAGEWEKTRKIQAESQEAVRVAFEKVADHDERKENSMHQARRLKKKVDRLEKELAGMTVKQSESV
jgi:hypothetical protein